MEHLDAVTNFDLYGTNFIQIYYITSNVLVRGRIPACVKLDRQVIGFRSCCIPNPADRN